MPLHSARVARNVSDTLRERFGRAFRAGRRGSLVCITPATSIGASFFFYEEKSKLVHVRIERFASSVIQVMEEERGAEVLVAGVDANE